MIPVRQLGYFGEIIEYYSPHGLKELEARLHKVQEGRDPSMGMMALANSYNYPHPNRLACEISSVKRLRLLSTIKAVGTATREPQAQETKVEFKIRPSLGLFTAYFTIIALAIFTILFNTSFTYRMMLPAAWTALYFFGFILIVLTALAIYDFKKLREIASGIFI
jgi:hypothetical protein